jgi:hypothetical protein
VHGNRSSRIAFDLIRGNSSDSNVYYINRGMIYAGGFSPASMVGDDTP